MGTNLVIGSLLFLTFLLLCLSVLLYLDREILRKERNLSLSQVVQVQANLQDVQGERRQLETELELLKAQFEDERSAAPEHPFLRYDRPLDPTRTLGEP